MVIQHHRMPDSMLCIPMLWDGHYYFHFTDENTKSQRGTLCLDCSLLFPPTHPCLDNKNASFRLQLRSHFLQEAFLPRSPKFGGCRSSAVPQQSFYPCAGTVSVAVSRIKLWAPQGEWARAVSWMYWTLTTRQNAWHTAETSKYLWKKGGRREERKERRLPKPQRWEVGKLGLNPALSGSKD